MSQAFSVMSNNLHDDGLGSMGLSAHAFATLHGFSTNKVIRLCKQGRIFGARKHSRTKQWWIYPPAKLLPSPLRW